MKYAEDKKISFLVNLFLKNIGFKIVDGKFKEIMLIFNDFLTKATIKNVVQNRAFIELILESRKFSSEYDEDEVSEQRHYGRVIFEKITFEAEENLELSDLLYDCVREVLIEKFNENFDDIINYFLNFKDYYFLILERFFYEKALNNELTKEQIISILDKTFDVDYFGEYVFSFDKGNFAISIGKGIKKAGNAELYDIWKKTLIEKSCNLENEEENNEAKKNLTALLNRFDKNSINDSALIHTINYTHSLRDDKVLLSLSRSNSVELSILSRKTIKNINIKRLNQLINLFIKRYNEDIKDKLGGGFDNSAFYGYRMLVIKMVMMFGYSSAESIINGDYGDFSYSNLENMFLRAPIGDYTISEKNAEPDHTESQLALKHFLLTSNSGDSNSLLKKIARNEISLLDVPISKILNNWKNYYDYFDGRVTLKTITEYINKSVESSPFKELDFVFKIADDSERLAIESTYIKMNQRSRSTIPKVSGNADGYEYEILDLKSVRQMTVGYSTHCCFTFGGVADSALKRALTCDSDRIFVIKDHGRIVAQSWVWRIGNVMCFDDIEVYGVQSNISDTVLRMYYEAAKNIVEISKQTEDESKRIKLVTIGKAHSKVPLSMDEVSKENTLVPPVDIYTDAARQVVLFQDTAFTKSEEFDVEPIYQDDRKPITILNVDTCRIEDSELANDILNKINALVDKFNYKKIDVDSMYKYVAYGEDWYIAVDEHGKVTIKSFGTDERKDAEISKELESLKASLSYSNEGEPIKIQ